MLRLETLGTEFESLTIHSPISEAQRYWLAGWEPGRPGKDEGVWRGMHVVRWWVVRSPFGDLILINCNQSQ